MVFSKDDLAVIVMCFTEKGWTGTRIARLLSLKYLARIVYEGRRKPFANLEDLQNVIRDKWHDVDDQTVRKAILQWKRRLAAVAKFKAEWRTYSAHFLLTS